MKKYAVYAVLIITVILFVNVGRNIFTNKVETQLVTSGTIEDVVSSEGYIVKNEQVYSGNATGYVQPAIDEGERVGVGQRLVSVYTDTTDNSLKNQLDMVNSKIEAIEQNSMQKEIFENDKVKLESMAADEILSLPQTVYQNKYQDITTKKSNVNSIIERIRKVTGQDGPAADTLESLTQRKAQLERQLGNSKTDIYCKASGIFSLRIDGLESILTPESILLLTPSKYKEIKTQDPSDYAVCKIVDNTKYYVVVCVSANKIMPLSVGNYVKVRFPDLLIDELDGKVSYISTEEDKNVVVAVEVNRYVPDIYSTRQTKVDIIKATYEGLSIPVSAIRMNGDKKGIYVLNNNIMKFKEINILHNSNDYAVIEEAVTLDNSSVKLYDEVVIKAKKYEDGLLVG